MALSFVLLLPSALAAQRVKPADRGPWEITGFMGAMDDRPEFDPDGSDLFLDPDKNLLFGAGLNYHFSPGFFVGAEGRYVPFDLNPSSGTVVDLNSWFYSGLVGYSLPVADRSDLYVVGGVSGVYWDASDYNSETDIGFNYGGGIRLYLLDNLSLNGDFRMFQVPKAMQDVTQSVAGLTVDQTFWGYSFTGGLSLFLGRKDSDGDGVKDGDDACPGTPPRVEVDARGCPLDSDRDGVADFQDRCPNTPIGARVNAEGCPLDSDADGVFDGLDRCPNTPAGAQVDQNGCPTDSDGDGVFDGLDRCPNTPRGTEVDREGCPLPEPEPEVETRFVLSGNQGEVNFGFDSAELTARGREALREIGNTLVQADDLALITIEGHTDSVGPEQYNLDLSRRRAEAVRDFLVVSFPQLADTQFNAIGVGEARPVASNDTEEGRAQNRRVEIIVGG
jgi:OOP family OmpA-OmpF porin